MTTRFRRAAGLILAVALAVPAGTVAARPRPAPVEDDEARIVHALNRLTFGPRPGDVEAVQRIGLQEWISRQLHPERIPDDALGPRLAPLTTLGLSPAEILRGYDPPPALKKEIQKRRAGGGGEGGGEGERE